MNRLQSKSLRYRWSLWTSSVMVLTYILLSVVLFTALSQWVLANERTSAENTFSELEYYMLSRGPELSVQDFERNTGLLNQFLSRNQSAKLLNADGVELVVINPTIPYPRFTGTLNEFERSTVADEDVLYKVTPFEIGSGSLYIAMSHSLENYSSMMSYLLLALLLFGVLFVILSGLTGYFLSSVLTKPLEELKLAMQQNMLGNKQKVKFSYVGDDEIGQLTSEYLEMVKRMDEVYAMQERFIGNVSHELRSPIQAIEGNASMLARWGKEDPKLVEETVDVIQSETLKMKRMMETLLALAKEQELEQQELSIDQVVREVVKELQQSNPDVQFEVSVEPIIITSSEILIRQALLNVIVNGIRYNEKSPFIQITGTSQNETYEIKIKDNGIGISKEQVERITEPFYTVDPARSKKLGGTGLGLTLVKQIIERSGGGLVIESEHGVGSEFTLQLPINRI